MLRPGMLAGPEAQGPAARKIIPMQSALDEFAEKISSLIAEQDAPAMRKRSVPRSFAPSAAAAPAAAAPAPVTGMNQIILPAITWDWPVATAGSISQEQFQFSDTIPQSVQKATEYAPSAGSFSVNYRTFLEFIDAGKFPVPALLNRAKSAISEPAGSAAGSTNVPPGWTRVTRVGIQRWAPIWTLSRSAFDWTSKVLSGAISNPGSFVVDLRNTAGGDEVLTRTITGTGATGPVPGADGVFRQVTISAEAWGQISIHPGSWFDSSMLALGRNYVPDADTFFGPAGLLRGRVSAFLVAYKAEFDFAPEKPVDAQLANVLNQRDDIRAFGVPVASDAAVNAGQQATVRLKSTSSAPAIVVAIIERFGTGA